jgi:hypothetical protein
MTLTEADGFDVGKGDSGKIFAAHIPNAVFFAPVHELTEVDLN